jgi:glycosyltransferase involved in cell wall biosynthesis
MRRRALSGGTVFLLGETFRSPGGIQTFNRALVQAVRTCRPAEPLAALVLNDGPRDVSHREWDGLVRRAFSRRKWAFAAAAMVRAARQRPRRIILGHRNLLPLAPFLARASARSRIWLLVYGIDARPALRPAERRALRAVQAVFAISPQTAAAFRAEAGYAGEPALWPCSLPYGWALPEVDPPKMEAPFRVLVVSRLAPPERYKGVDTVIRAVAEVRRRGLPVELDVVGDGADRARLERIASEDGASSAVRFHGQVEDQALRAAYAGCDLFALCSAREGFGIVYLEAMAFGRPVVAAAAGAAPFVVRPDVSGYLVPFGDAVGLAECLAQRLRDPSGSRRMGLRARRFLEENFTFDRLVDRTAAILDAA